MRYRINYFAISRLPDLKTGTDFRGQVWKQENQEFPVPSLPPQLFVVYLFSGEGILVYFLSKFHLLNIAALRFHWADSQKRKCIKQSSLPKIVVRWWRHGLDFPKEDKFCGLEKKGKWRYSKIKYFRCKGTTKTSVTNQTHEIISNYWMRSLWYPE